MESEALSGKEGLFIASCIVTNAANAKWLKLVKRSLPLLRDGEKIYLSGCAPIRGGKIDEAFYGKYGDLLPFKNKIVLLDEDPESGLEQKIRLKKTMERVRNIASGEGMFTRKYVQIQTGCDGFCTYCATVLARGKHVNRDKEEILSEISAFANQ